jgi:hypothetical protein
MAAGFSANVLGRPLRDYQKQILAAILESVHRRHGATFTVMMARQMGKNETSAHLELMLLCRYVPKGATIVKAAPTFRPQVATSLQRFEQFVREAEKNGPLTRRYPDGREVTLKLRREHGYRLYLGDGSVIFLSADPSASVAGATASHALEIDEAQDVDPEKYARDFRPMAAANNATTILYGTAWTDQTLLELHKQENLRLQAQDGVQRHFEFDWRHGAAANKAYGDFVRAEIERYSIQNPFIKTQYLLQTLSDQGTLFSPETRALMRGEHPRQTAPLSDDDLPPDSYYVAGIDIAGPSEDASDVDAILRARQPRKDSTAVLIAQVTPAADSRTGETDKIAHPITKIVQAFWWTGHPLHEQCDGLISILKEWRCARVVVDASGIGADLAERLQRALGEPCVERFAFNVPSKSELTFALLNHANSGRLQMWDERPRGSSGRGPKQPLLRTKVLLPATQGFAALSLEAGEFWRVVERARPIHRTSGSGHFGPNKLSFYVPEQYGHDDFLIALALCSRAACSQVRASTYKWESWIVPPRPTQWELEERQHRFSQIAASMERDFYASMRRSQPAPTPPPPPAPSYDPASSVFHNPPAFDPSRSPLHSLSSDPPPVSKQSEADADAMYDQMRRNMGLDP